MKVIEEIKLNKALKKIELFLCENSKKQPVLVVKCPENGRTIHLKRFFGYQQYRKWLLEAVLLHILVGDSYKKDLVKTYQRLSQTLQDDSNDKAL